MPVQACFVFNTTMSLWGKESYSLPFTVIWEVASLSKILPPMSDYLKSMTLESRWFKHQLKKKKWGKLRLWENLWLSQDHKLRIGPRFLTNPSSLPPQGLCTCLSLQLVPFPPLTAWLTSLPPSGLREVWPFQGGPACLFPLLKTANHADIPCPPPGFIFPHSTYHHLMYQMPHVFVGYEFPFAAVTHHNLVA